MQKAKLTLRESIVVILDETGLNKTLEHHTMKTTLCFNEVRCKMCVCSHFWLAFQIYARPVCIFISQFIPDTKNDENCNKKILAPEAKLELPIS